MTFTQLKISPQLAAALSADIKQPTEIQTLAIPVVLANHDLLALAQTGSGKTLAYGLPIIQRAMNKAEKQTLIIVPTRELATQVFTAINSLGSKLSLQTTLLVGGSDQALQMKQLAMKPQIIVATPGRLLALINDKTLDTSNIQTLVLDEADRLVDMGFWPDIQSIIAALPAKVESQRQTLLFTATTSKELQEKLESVLHRPTTITAESKLDDVSERIDEHLYLVNKGSKANVLIQQIKQHAWSQVLVFVGARDNADALCKKLNKAGLSAASLHGNKDQQQRETTLQQFKDKQLNVLVATDLLARGVHIDTLPVVVNFEIPEDPKTYIHRIGRTARAGDEGVAISLVSHSEMDNLLAIRALTTRTLDLKQLEAFPVTDKPASGNSKRAPKDKQANRRTNSKKSIKQFKSKPKR